jgi:predicted DNA-binding ribbon-helix-helix protein
MSTIKKRSVTLHGHRTSFSIEDEFFQILESTAKSQAIPLARLIAIIDEARGSKSNLSSALRLAALASVRRTD